MDRAEQNKSIKDPTAMTLATVGTNGQPHARIVLLKDFSLQGLVFYTHYQSQKGQDLANQPKASVSFFWPELDQQIHIEGVVEKVEREQSKAYFNSRPIDSQLAASISNQSHEIASRAELESLMVKATLEHKNNQEQTIPLPEHWGGYRLVPNKFEFWQGRPNRLHDRLVYTSKDSIWQIKRLAP
jgi:pyridoxamine-phosphate oxidase